MFVSPSHTPFHARDASPHLFSCVPLQEYRKRQEERDAQREAEERAAEEERQREEAAEFEKWKVGAHMSQE